MLRYFQSVQDRDCTIGKEIQIYKPPVSLLPASILSKDEQTGSTHLVSNCDFRPTIRHTSPLLTPVQNCLATSTTETQSQDTSAEQNGLAPSKRDPPVNISNKDRLNAVITPLTINTHQPALILCFFFFF